MQLQLFSFNQNFVLPTWTGILILFELCSENFTEQKVIEWLILGSVDWAVIGRDTSSPTHIFVIKSLNPCDKAL